MDVERDGEWRNLMTNKRETHGEFIVMLAIKGFVTRR